MGKRKALGTWQREVSTPRKGCLGNGTQGVGEGDSRAAGDAYGPGGFYTLLCCGVVREAQKVQLVNRWISALWHRDPRFSQVWAGQNPVHRPSSNGPYFCDRVHGMVASFCVVGLLMTAGP